MFFTEQLNVIPYLFADQEWSDPVRKKLNLAYLNLEATLLRAKVVRSLSSSKLIYSIQSSIHAKTSDLAYLFMPFILANLNKRNIYATPATQTVLTVLNKYYQADQISKFNIENTLDALNLYLDLSDSDISEEEFFYNHLIKALSRTDISTIFLMTDLNIDQKNLKALADFLNVKIVLISTQDRQEILDSSVLNMRQLLFKNKDQTYMNLCALFAQKNAEILTKIEHLNSAQSINFIEDMFYAEHIYEKISVYAEYVQTQIQYTRTNQRVS